MASTRSVVVAWWEKKSFEATGAEPAYYCTAGIVKYVCLLSRRWYYCICAHTCISTRLPHPSPRGYTRSLAHRGAKRPPATALLDGENKRKDVKACTTVHLENPPSSSSSESRRLGDGSIYMPAQLKEAKQQREGVRGVGGGGNVN